jgi:hypothetical protein
MVPAVPIAIAAIVNAALANRVFPFRHEIAEIQPGCPAAESLRSLIV